MAEPEKNLSDAFNDPANKKFRKIWMKEADIVDDFEMAVEWFRKWSRDRDAFASKHDEPREKFAQGLVDFWDRYLVKTAGRLANHKAHVEAGKDEVTAEFTKKNLTGLTELYDALSKLDDTQIKSGKAIFDALLPLMEEAPAPQPKPATPGPLDKGNPFKKPPQP